MLAEGRRRGEEVRKRVAVELAVWRWKKVAEDVGDGTRIWDEGGMEERESGEIEE